MVHDPNEGKVENGRSDSPEMKTGPPPLARNWQGMKIQFERDFRHLLLLLAFVFFFFFFFSLSCLLLSPFFLPPRMDLLYALQDENGDLNFILDLIMDGEVDVSLADQNGNTALHLACSRRANPDERVLIDALLETRLFDVDRVNAEGWTPLHLAAKSDNVHAVEALFKYGAYILALAEGETPLDIALENDAGNVTHMLLEMTTQNTEPQPPEQQQHPRSRSPDDPPPHSAVTEMEWESDSPGRHWSPSHSHAQEPYEFGGRATPPSPLFMNPSVGSPFAANLSSVRPPFFPAASRRDDERAPGFYTDENVRLADREGKSAIHLAAERGDHRLIENLLTLVPIDLPDESRGRTALHWAALSDKTECVLRLLRLGASPRVADRQGKTPLALVLEKKMKPMVDLLLGEASGGDIVRDHVNQQTDDTLLHVAAKGGNLDLVRTLLRTNANFADSRNLDGLTVLHSAVQSGKIEIFREVANSPHGKGAIDATTELGSGPVHFATQGGNVTMLKALVALGADLDLANEAGETPISLAATSGNLECLDYLLDQGADFETRDANGQCPMDHLISLLHDYPDNDDYRHCHDLLEDVTAKTKAETKGMSSLQLAVRKGKIELIRKLLNRGEDPAAPDAQRNSALHTAFQVPNPSLHIVQLLMEHPSSLWGSLNKNFQTPVEVALDIFIPPPAPTAPSSQKPVAAQQPPPAQPAPAQFQGNNWGLNPAVPAEEKALYVLFSIPMPLRLQQLPPAPQQLNRRQQQPQLFGMVAQYPYQLALANQWNLSPHNGPQEEIALYILHNQAVPGHLWATVPLEKAAPQPLVAAVAPAAAAPAPPPQDVTKRNLPQPIKNYVRGQLEIVLRDPKKSDPARLWAAKRATKLLQMPTMDKIMELTGIREVKLEALNLYDTVEMDKNREEEARLSKQTLNFFFIGNPGTGKTTVARLFGQLLCDLGIRAKDNFVETSGQKLLSDGADTFSQKTLPACIPGVLFIDEVYQLDPMGNSEGRKITNAIMEATENSRDKLTVIIAGYKEDVREKFFASNQGLPSRFPREVLFADFNEVDFRRLVLSTVSSKRWKLDQGPTPDVSGRRPAPTGVDTASIAARRLARGAGSKGFGNARACRILIEQAITRANDRLQQRSHRGEKPSDDEIVTLLRADILGERIDLTITPAQGARRPHWGERRQGGGEGDGPDGHGKLCPGRTGRESH